MSISIEQTIVDTDVLIIGSGLAGLLLALRLHSAGARVVMASKAGLADSNSAMAQGGVAAVTGANPFDSPEQHLADTLAAGAGLTDEAAARAIVFGGGRLIAEFEKLGVDFDKTGGGGSLDLALEGGHKQARVLHHKDTTGRSIVEALTDEIWRRVGKNLIVAEGLCALDLVVSEGQCRGAQFLRDEEKIFVRASHTVLATGGVGQVFERTTNPAIATADGIAMAYRAGAELVDMEFVQFHPTALRLDDAPAFLISEAVRGAGATLLDGRGRRFVGRFHHDGELATRDVVSRAIHTVMTEHGLNEVFLDLRPIGAEKIAARFPNIVSTCARYGIDVFERAIPVAPAAHYMMGGIRADVSGRTSLNGLYAIGECASTGLHGANRLASNSLLEAGVMALNLADTLTASGFAGGGSKGATYSGNEVKSAKVLPLDLADFRRSLYRNCGLVRSRAGLNAVLSAPSQRFYGELTGELAAARNIFQVGQLIAGAALLREESRGAHLREEFALVDDVKFARHLTVSRAAVSSV